MAIKEDYAMKVSIVGKGKDKVLVIEIPMQEPKESASGKTLVVATTSGNKVFDDVKVDGMPITLGLNAYIKKAK